MTAASRSCAALPAPFVDDACTPGAPTSFVKLYKLLELHA